MANQYLKSVRTRFWNTLKRENEIANNILEEFTLAEEDGSGIDKEALTKKTREKYGKNPLIPRKVRESVLKNCRSVKSEIDPAAYQGELRKLVNCVIIQLKVILI